MLHDEATEEAAHFDQNAKLIRMANQIAIFFASKPREEGVAGVVEHINKFWEPRMRAQLFKVHDGEPDRLHELVRAAMPDIRPVPERAG